MIYGTKLYKSILILSSRCDMCHRHMYIIKLQVFYRKYIFINKCMFLFIVILIKKLYLKDYLRSL